MGSSKAYVLDVKMLVVGQNKSMRILYPNNYSGTLMKHQVLTIMVSLCCCLALHQSPTPKQYLSSMLERQTKLRQDLRSLKQSIEMLKSKLSSSAGSEPDDQVKLLSETLAEERDIITRVESYLSLPFSLSACQCLNITDKADVEKALQGIQIALQKLTQEASRCELCPQIREINGQILKESQYVTNIRQILDADCCAGQQPPRVEKTTGAVNLNTSTFITNLEGTKWIYGNTSEKEYKLKMFALSSKQNVTKCKPQSPVTTDGKACMNCPADQPIWNVGESRCAKCLNDQQYSASQHVCRKPPPPKVVAPITARPKTCSAGELLDQNLNQCHQKQEGKVSNLYKTKNWITSVPLSTLYKNLAHNLTIQKKIQCPIQNPYYDQITCVPCHLPKVFNLDTSLCQPVPADRVYDNNVHQLLPKDPRAYNTVPNSSNLIVLRPSDKPIATNDLCPVSNPYYDGIACIKCQQPFPLFNTATKKCERCLNDFYYSQADLRCIKVLTQQYTDLEARGLLIPGERTIEDERLNQKEMNKAGGAVYKKCPEDKPYFDGNQCINCPSDNPLFNIITRKCTKCEDGYTFFWEINKCTRDLYSTNLENGKKILASSNYGVTEYNHWVEEARKSNAFNKLSKCPDPNRPYAVNWTCVACDGDKPLFDLQSKTCTQCQITQDYDPQTLFCRNFGRITSPNSPNLFLRGQKLLTLRKQYDQQRAKNPQLRDCPPSAPYFNGKTCMSCPTDRPLFDVEAKDCTKCRDGTSFDEKTNSCMATGRVDATLERMIMNIG